METTKDITREMRIELDQSGWYVDREKIHDMPDRIDAAVNREIKAIVDAEDASMKVVMAANAMTTKVVETLKHALKAVLEVDTEYYTLSNAEDALDACRDAQRMIEESGVLDDRVGETGDADY